MQAPEMEEPRQEDLSDCSCSRLSPFLNLFLSRGFTSLCPGSTSCFLQIQLRQLLAHHAKFPGALEPLDSLGPNVGESQASRQGWDCSKSTSLGNWGESQKSKLQKQRNRQLIEHRFLLPERLKYRKCVARISEKEARERKRENGRGRGREGRKATACWTLTPPCSLLFLKSLRLGYKTKMLTL